jgi:hypothetical protein
MPRDGRSAHEQEVPARVVALVERTESRIRSAADVMQHACALLRETRDLLRRLGRSDYQQDRARV